MAWIINPKNPSEELEVVGNQLTGNSRPAPGVGLTPPAAQGSPVSPPGSVATGLGPQDFAAFQPPAAPIDPALVPIPKGPSAVPAGPPLAPMAPASQAPIPVGGPPSPGEMAPQPPAPPPSLTVTGEGPDTTANYGSVSLRQGDIQVPSEPSIEKKPDDYEDIAQLQARQQELQTQALLNEDARKKELGERLKQVDSMRRDVASYKVDPSYLFHGRPIMKPLTESPERLAERQKQTTKEMAAMKLSDDPDERRRQLARAAVEKGRAMREEQVEVGREGGMNGLQQIGLIIAAAFQSYASGMAGRDPTAGMKLIDSLLDRDMERQKIELDKRKDLLGNEVNALGQMRQMFESERAAENALQAMQIQAARTELDKIATRADTEAKRIAAKQMDTQLAQRGQQLMLEGMKFEDDAIMNRQRLGVSKYEAQTNRMALFLKDKADKEARIPTQEIKDLESVLGSFDAIRRTEEAWNSMRESAGWEPTGKAMAGAGVNTAGAEYLRTRNTTVAQSAKMFGYNPTDKDLARTQELQPNPEDSDATARSKLEASKKLAIDQALTRIKSLEAAGYDMSGQRKLLAQKMALISGNVDPNTVK